MENTNNTIEAYIVNRLRYLEGMVASLEDTKAELEEELNKSDEECVRRQEIIKALVEQFNIRRSGQFDLFSASYYPTDDTTSRLLLNELDNLKVLPPEEPETAAEAAEPAQEEAQ